MAEAKSHLEGWVADHQPVVYRAARLILRDDGAAEDVAQETFIRASRHAHRLDPGSEVGPWLYRIAVNLALNRLRSRRREQRALARLGYEGPSALGDDLDQRTTGASVSEAVRRLPDRLRIPVILRYYLDLPEREIARALGVRPGTAKSRLHEARRVLAGDRSLAALVNEE
jgi:RNA polymerase sigma-70 factor (ECF subfamily)